MTRRAAAPWLLVAALGACYKYVPAPTTNVIPGAIVRIVIADTCIRAVDGGAEPELAKRLGVGTESVEGRVVSASDDGILLAVSATIKHAEIRGDPPSRVVWAGETVPIPYSAMAAAERRTVDRGRTVRAAIIGAAATFVAIRVIGHFAGSSGGGGDDGGVVVPP